MILFFLLLLAVLGAGTGCTVGMMTLYLALDIFLFALFPELGAEQYIVLAVVCLSIPLTAYLAGLLLDRFSFSSTAEKTYGALAMVLAFGLILNSDVLWAFFEAALSVMQQASPGTGLLLITAGVNAIVFCAGLIAFVLMVLHLGLELPVLWLTRASGVKLRYCFSALRPLTVLIGLTMASNLILGLLADELWPTTLINF